VLVIRTYASGHQTILPFATRTGALSWVLAQCVWGWVTLEAGRLYRNPADNTQYQIGL
jgi:hypothetical protein